MKYCKVNNSWREITVAFKKVDGGWVMLTDEQLSEYLNGHIFKYGHHETVLVVHTLMIGGASNAVGETGTYMAIYDGSVAENGVSWSVVSGTSYASISQTGELTILNGASASPVTIMAQYNGLSVVKDLSVTYDPGTTSETETETAVETNESGQTITTTTTTTTTTDASGNTTTVETTTQIVENEDGSLSSIEQETVENPDGSTTSNTSTTNYDENGNTTSTQTSEVVENPDGSSSSNTVTVNYDESGNTTGSQTNQTIGNSDGSYGSNTTNYDSEGNPTDTTNESGDTAGNVDTQQIEYDESGTPVVTEYNIDTSGSDGNGKEIEGNGINTEFVPFKFASQGFVINFDFESTAAEQPRPPITEDTEDTGSNYLYTVLGAKTTVKVGNIWPGFEIRWAIPKSNPNFNDTSKCLIQFNRTLYGETGTTRTNFTTGYCTNGVYHLTIIYDPSDSTKFKVRNNVSNSNIQTSNVQIQDNVDLDLTIGYSTDHNGNQIRHSNVTIHDFNVVKLNSAATITQPSISCDGVNVVMSCSTQGAKIYYKVSTDTKYDLYKSPIQISADTTFNAYAIFQQKVSSVKTQSCIFDDGTPDTPVITCDGDYITITCQTQGASIYYKLSQNGEFAQYSSPIAINENTTVYAYSVLNGISSTTVSENCIATVVAAPVISCNGRYVTISCETENATIHYKLGENGNYTTYNNAIAINTDTLVYAYATLGSKSSTTVSETCIFNDEVSAPIIYCNGQYITITCETPSADIRYKLNEDLTYSDYLEPIRISADTMAYAYAMLDGQSSTTVSALCEFIQVVDEPVISCENNEVSMTCATENADIYYRFSIEDNYEQYTIPFEISATTFVQAFAELNGVSSTTVDTICAYEDPNHDYSQDYLTFRVLSGGTIAWSSVGTGHTDTIQYKKNNGEWTSITATSTGTKITVDAGDVVMFKGTNTTYSKDKNNHACFNSAGTATFDIEGNILSLLYGDNFTSTTALTNSTFQFCSIFKTCKVVSAENLILPSTTLTNYCYRAMFSWCTTLEIAPALPATTLAQGCYWYMFEHCGITEAPELLATTLVRECYGYMFTNCSNLNYIKCLATSGFNAASALTGWVTSVAATGTFVKDENTTWSRGTSGIPNGWTIVNYSEFTVNEPEISCDGEHITISCVTSGADIYYKLNQTGNFELYSSPITINADTITEAFATTNGVSSSTVTQTCSYLSSIPLEYSNRSLNTFMYNNNEIETPYSINAIDGHSSNYATGNSFNFETDVVLREAQPTYLWFQHADQSADIYVDDVKVETHWGGYNAFFSDISNYVHSGTNRIKVGLCNRTRSTLAPCKGDFNYNATLGNVKLFTSPVLPETTYGYDGFHVTSSFDTVQSSATVNVKTTIPVGAVVCCSVSGVNCNYSESGNSTGNELLFTTTIQNPRLWDGKIDPYLYDIQLEIYHDGELYHRYQRGYGIRFFDYAISGTTMSGETGYTYNGQPYTGFLLNGKPYFLRGVCMHDDLAGKANALNDNDYSQEFAIVQELGCNFIRLAHYPHPKEVYDWCDRLGIIVQTEVPWVGAASSGAPADYYTHLEGQYRDMVNQHYNHPSIVFWGLSNETTTENTQDAKNFIKDKIEGYTAVIKSLDQSRWVGYVMSHSYNDPSAYYNHPNVDWFGGNIYTGWYVERTSNNPSSQLNTRINNIINARHKPLAFSEYGCGGTQRCHSESAETTTTKGTNMPRHDIEYMMWLHEGHIAALRNYPQLLFTGEWQLFDIAVYNRQEGYTICLDGETTSTDNNLKFLNNKGLVERDHVTKKDPFYLYKAEWNPTPFVHICGKEYTRMVDRKIKCYTNDGNELRMYIGDSQTPYMTAQINDHIAEFSAATFTTGTTIRVVGDNSSDTMTF